MLVVTRGMKFAKEIADKIILLDGGKIFEEDSRKKSFIVRGTK